MISYKIIFEYLKTRERVWTCDLYMDNAIARILNENFLIILL